MSSVECLAVDWGTTSFRLWALDGAGRVVAERRSDEGLIVAGKTGFNTVLEAHAAALGVRRDVPAMLCGMVGSRAGWLEVDYLSTPISLEELVGRAVAVPGADRHVAILPGIAQRDPDRPDVMRGEETKLLGLGRTDGLVLMPGTHTKWAEMAGGRLQRFSTFMTGEIFAHLRTGPASVLRQAVEEGGEIDIASAAFADAVRDAIAEPELLPNRLFGVRAGWLLHGRSGADNLARLSGLLIGTEIAGAKKLYKALDGVVLVGAGPGAAAYQRALDVAGASDVSLVDADQCVRSGLLRASRLLHVGEERS